MTTYIVQRTNGDRTDIEMVGTIVADDYATSSEIIDRAYEHSDLSRNDMSHWIYEVDKEWEVETQ